MNINFDKISIIDGNFSVDRLKKLKEIANHEKMILTDSKHLYKDNINSKLDTLKDFPLSTKATERIYLSSEYSKYSMDDKNIILSNIVFSRNESFANIIALSGLTIEQLDKYIQIVTFFNDNRILLNSKNAKIVKLIEYVNKISLILGKYVHNHYPKTTNEMIINKLSEMLTFDKELINEKYDEFALKKERIEIENKNNELKKMTARVKYDTVSKDNTKLIDSFVKSLSNVNSLELIYYTCFNKKDDKCHIDFCCIFEDNINITDVEIVASALNYFASSMKELNVIINYDVMTNTELCLNIKKQDEKTIKRLTGANLVYQKKLGLTKIDVKKHK